MAIYIVKVSHDRGQTRLTIPKRLAEEMGLDKADIVAMQASIGKNIIVREWHGEKRRDRADS